MAAEPSGLRCGRWCRCGTRRGGRLHGAPEVRRRIRRGHWSRRRSCHCSSLCLGAVVALHGMGGGHRRLGIGRVEGVGPVGPGRVRVTAVEARLRYADQWVAVAVAGLERIVGARSDASSGCAGPPHPRCRRCRWCTCSPTRSPPGRRGCGSPVRRSDGPPDTSRAWFFPSLPPKGSLASGEPGLLLVVEGGEVIGRTADRRDRRR